MLAIRRLASALMPRKWRRPSSEATDGSVPGGGAARTVLNAIKTGKTLLTGEEWLPEETPFLRRVYSEQTTTSRLREFYNAWEEVNQAYYEVGQLRKLGDTPSARQATEDHKAEMKAYPALKGARKRLDAIGDRRAAIEANDKMATETRRRLLDDLARQEADTVSRGLKAYQPD